MLSSNSHSRALIIPAPSVALPPAPCCLPHLLLEPYSITFVSLGQMAGVLNKKGDMPRSNIAFLADAFGTTLGGLLGSSALTTYVESASAMREGGRTGFTAVVCSLFFLASIALW
jgi:hypothetical protein